MIYFLLVISGLFGGFLAGLFGVGGGIIYVIILPYALSGFGVEPDDLAHFTIANSLLAVIFTSLSALYRHYRLNNLYPKQSVILGLTGGLTAISMTVIFVETAVFSMELFNWILLLLLAYMLIDLFLGIRKNSRGERREKNWLYVPIGFAGGVVAAVSGLGGGVAVIPLIAKFQRKDFRQITSISMGFIAISALLVSIYNAMGSPRNSEVENSLGFLVFPVTMTLVIGVVIGAQFGVRFGQRVGSEYIRYGFMILLSTLIIYKGFEIYIHG